jgi:hypothetical protein
MTWKQRSMQDLTRMRPCRRQIPAAAGMVACQLLLAVALWSVPSAALAQPLLRCGQPVTGQLGAGGVDVYRLEQWVGDRVLVEAVDTSGNLGLLRLRARLADGTIQGETCRGSLPLKTAIGLVSVSDCFPNLTADQIGQYTVTMNVVSKSPGNCGRRLVCGSSLTATAVVPGEVDAYTFPAYVAGEVVTLKVLAAAANKFAISLRVFDPDGDPVPVPGTTTCVSAATMALPRRGEYTVLVSACAGQLTGSYALSFEPPACIAITIGNAVAPVDRTAAFSVFLHTLGETVVAVRNDIDFKRAVPIAATDNGTPACRVNPDINKPDTIFAFRPDGCAPGVDCTGIRATVFATGNVDPIPDGLALYTCSVRPAVTAVIGTLYPLTCAGAGANITAAQPVPVLCSDGTVLAAVSACPGDCSDDGQVTVDELLTGVGIALGALPVTRCPVFDTNGDGMVAIDELLKAVDSALTGCEPSPTPVPVDAALTQPVSLQADRG